MSLPSSLVPALMVIPARAGSVRLPNKPLADIHGRPMIQWTWERACRARHPLTRARLECVVATDSEEIAQVVRSFGAPVILTAANHRTGTERVAEVARRMPAEAYVNVQGDEPDVAPEAIECALALVIEQRFRVGTAMTPLNHRGELEQSSVVKVIADAQGRAIYFSRLPIPYGLGIPEGPWVCYRHIGVYAYHPVALQEWAARPMHSIESAEGLEQLRALAAGVDIGIAKVARGGMGVDTPEDLERARIRLQGVA